MGEQIKNTGNELMERWHKEMPRFFYWLVVIACGIGGLAVAIHFGLPALGGTHSAWWDEVYRYVVSTCIGVIFTCKFTVAGGYKKVDPDKLINNSPIDKEGE